MTTATAAAAAAVTAEPSVLISQTGQTVCLAHFCETDPIYCISVCVVMRRCEIEVELGKFTVCKASTCQNCKKSFEADAKVAAVGSQTAREETCFLLFHPECLTKSNAWVPVFQVNKSRILGAGSGSLDNATRPCHVLSVLLDDRTQRFIKTDTKCARCNERLKSDDRVLCEIGADGRIPSRLGYLDYEQPYNGVVHQKCGKRCKHPGCFISTQSETDVLCRHHAKRCDKCSGFITVPGEACVVSYAMNNKTVLAIQKHKECASLDDMKTQLRVICCRESDCKRQHAFEHCRLISYTGSTKKSSFKVSTYDVVACLSLLCDCCCAPLQTSRFNKTTVEFMDGWFFCGECFNSHGGNSYQDCRFITVASRDCDAHLKCIRHIGRGWSEAGRNRVGPCLKCKGWVCLRGADDGCFVLSGMMHHACRK
jgi:hypothetical protein